MLLQGNKVVSALVKLFKTMNVQAASTSSAGSISTADLRGVFQHGKFAKSEMVKPSLHLPTDPKSA